MSNFESLLSRARRSAPTFARLFVEDGCGFMVTLRWIEADIEALESAAKTIERTEGANAWVFSADAQHFLQFASTSDWEALGDMIDAEQIAILGEYAVAEIQAGRSRPDGVDAQRRDRLAAAAPELLAMLRRVYAQCYGRPSAVLSSLDFEHMRAAIQNATL